MERLEEEIKRQKEEYKTNGLGLLEKVERLKKIVADFEEEREGKGEFGGELDEALARMFSKAKDKSNSKKDKEEHETIELDNEDEERDEET